MPALESFKSGGELVLMANCHISLSPEDFFAILKKSLRVSIPTTTWYRLIARCVPAKTRPPPGKWQPGHQTMRSAAASRIVDPMLYDLMLHTEEAYPPHICSHYSCLKRFDNPRTREENGGSCQRGGRRRCCSSSLVQHCCNHGCVPPPPRHPLRGINIGEGVSVTKDYYSVPTLMLSFFMHNRRKFI